MLVDGINVIKKPFVDALLENMTKLPEIKGLILFGSVLTEACTEESDVDYILIFDADEFENNFGLRLYEATVNAFTVLDTDTDELHLRSFDEFYTQQSMLYEHLRNTNSYKILLQR